MLRNKRAVITGGSEGIGFGIAKQFIENGAKVLLVGRSKEKLEQAKKALGYENVFTIETDLSFQEKNFTLLG